MLILGLLVGPGLLCDLPHAATGVQDSDHQRTKLAGGSQEGKPGNVIRPYCLCGDASRRGHRSTIFCTGTRNSVQPAAGIGQAEMNGKAATSP